MEGRETPKHDVMLAFTRMLAGPMDYTPGGFDNVTWENFTPRNRAPMVMHTRAHATALSVVLESALQMVSDSPDAYTDQKETEFLKAVPSTWDETRVIAGSPTSYITIARRRGDEWFLGSITGWDACELHRRTERRQGAEGNGVGKTRRYWGHRTEMRAGAGRRLRCPVHSGPVERWGRSAGLLSPHSLRTEASEIRRGAPRHFVVRDSDPHVGGGLFVDQREITGTASGGKRDAALARSVNAALPPVSDSRIVPKMLQPFRAAVMGSSSIS